MLNTEYGWKVAWQKRYPCMKRWLQLWPGDYVAMPNPDYVAMAAGLLWMWTILKQITHLIDKLIKLPKHANIFWLHKTSIGMYFKVTAFVVVNRLWVVMWMYSWILCVCVWVTNKLYISVGFLVTVPISIPIASLYSVHFIKSHNYPERYTSKRGAL